MLCQMCNNNHANIQLNLTVNGQRKEYMLCSNCYAKEKNAIGSSLGPNQNSHYFPFDKFFFTENPSEHKSNRGNQLISSNGGGFIDQFGRNLTQMARAGLIDPVIGRDEEVKRVTEILNRRNKNNPVLIGEPGVGKTAIAEGLALKIVDGNVPAKLQNIEVYLLDIASLVANTGIRG
ncbi:MAG: Clp protease ClpX, partial [Neobacillus sp.]|nr:Clp protease ClpX [Neobacillus sp.]